MAWTLKASTGAGTTGFNTTVTTTAIDTTGADLIIVSVAGQANAAAASLSSDSASNTWTKIKETDWNGRGTNLYYCHAPTTSSSHTFTGDGSGQGCRVDVLAYSGSAASPLDTFTFNAAAGITSIQPGSLTPAGAGELFVTSIGMDAGGTMSIDSSFTIEGQGTCGSWGGQDGMAYFVNSGSGALNPTWSFTSTQGGVVMAAFIAAAGGGSQTTITPSKGALKITGHAPTLAQTANRTITPTKGAVRFTGHAPTITQTGTGGKTITPSKGALSITGHAPTIIQTRKIIINPATGALVITGHAPIVSIIPQSPVITPAEARLILRTYAPSVTNTSPVTSKTGGDDVPRRRRKSPHKGFDLEEWRRNQIDLEGTLRDAYAALQGTPHIEEVAPFIEEHTRAPKARTAKSAPRIDWEGVAAHEEAIEALMLARARLAEEEDIIVRFLMSS